MMKTGVLAELKVGDAVTEPHDPVRPRLRCILLGPKISYKLLSFLLYRFGFGVSGRRFHPNPALCSPKPTLKREACTPDP